MSAKATKSTPEKNTPQNQLEPAEQDPLSPENQLTAIRTLLFGEQVKGINADIHRLTGEVNNRFRDLSHKLDQDLNRLATEFGAKLDDLAKHIEKLNKQRVNREQDLSAAIDDLRQKLEEAAQTSNQADDELHRELKSEADRLTRELTQHHNQAMAELKKTTQDLSSHMADRKTLATMLASMAEDLKSDE